MKPTTRFWLALLALGVAVVGCKTAMDTFHAGEAALSEKAAVPQPPPIPDHLLPVDAGGKPIRPVN